MSPSGRTEEATIAATTARSRNVTARQEPPQLQALDRARPPMAQDQADQTKNQSDGQQRESNVAQEVADRILQDRSGQRQRIDDDDPSVGSRLCDTAARTTNSP